MAYSDIRRSLNLIRRWAWEQSPEYLARQEYQRMQAPAYMAGELRDAAAMAAPGTDDMLRYARATGTSPAAAQELAQAEQARSRQQAFAQYGALRQGLDRSRLGALGMYGDLQNARLDREAQQEAQEGSLGSFLGGVVGMGLGALAGGAGAAIGGNIGSSLGEKLF